MVELLYVNILPAIIQYRYGILLFCNKFYSAVRSIMVVIALSGCIIDSYNIICLNVYLGIYVQKYLLYHAVYFYHIVLSFINTDCRCCSIILLCTLMV